MSCGSIGSRLVNQCNQGKIVNIMETKHGRNRN